MKSRKLEEENRLYFSHAEIATVNILFSLV